MTAENRTNLKAYFQTGDKPTQAQFIDLIDSFPLVAEHDLKAPLAAPTFTGTVVLPSTTSVGDVSATELAYVNGVTSAIQTQIDAKVAISQSTVGEMRPLENVVTVAEGTSPRPTDIWGGYLWGIVANTGAVHRSSDMGETWSAKIADFVASTQRMLPTDDGEVVFHTATTCYKTSGWTANPATCTYSSKATVTNNTYCSFLAWGFDSDSTGTKFILVEYASPDTEWDLSRKGLISVDGGDTFVLRWDSLTQHGSTDNNLTHLHGACYDEWRDRFWLSEGHGDAAGLFFSDDDGLNWTRHTGDVPRDASPTTLTATQHGIVLGTDSGNGGVYLLPYTTDQATANAEWIWKWQNETAQQGVAGFATRAHRDPVTGTILIGFFTAFTNITAPVVYTDGLVANRIHTQSGMLLNDQWFGVLSSDGKVAASLTVNYVVQNLRATLEYKRRAPSITVQDTGNVIGGSSGNITSVAVGATSSTGSNRLCTAINGSTDGSDESTIAIGCTATGALTVAIGALIDTASGNSVIIGDSAIGVGSFLIAIGKNAAVRNANSIGIGYNVSVGLSHDQFTAIGSGVTSAGVAGTSIGYASSCGFQSVVIGHGASAPGYATAIGKGCTVAEGGTAIGWSASQSGAAGTALGTLAVTTHDYGVALGYGVNTTAANQVAIANRHLELTEVADPAAGATNSGRLYTRDNGSGKTQLCVRFATGAVQVLATEP